MSNARDDRDWLERRNGESRSGGSVCSPVEEIGQMHFSTENYSTALEYFHKALKSKDIQAFPDKFRILLRINDCYRIKGDFEKAEQYLAAARAVLADTPDAPALAKVEFREAWLLYARGRYERALKLGFRAYRRLKHTGEHEAVADTQRMLANCYHRLGMMPEAEDFFTDALSTFRRIENKAGVAGVYINLGVLHKNACRWNRAQASLSKAYDIAKSLGLSQLLMSAQINLGVVYAKLRRFPEAIAEFSNAAVGAERFGDHLKLTRALLMLGRTHVPSRQFSRAEKNLLRAQAIADEFGYQRERALSLEYHAELLMAKRAYDEAAPLLEQALERAREFAPEGDVVAECLRRLADVEYARGRTSESLEKVESGIEAAEACGERYEMGYLFRTLALCRIRAGERTEAIAELRSSIAAFDENGNAFEKSVTRQRLAMTYLRDGSESSLLKARRELGESVVEFDRLDAGEEQIRSQILIATVESRLGKLDDALLAVYEGDRLSGEEHTSRFDKALSAIRRRIESRMSRATTRVVDQFSVLSDIQAGSRSRDNLVAGLRPTLRLILEHLESPVGYIAVPGRGGRGLQIAAREGIGARDAQAVTSWINAERDRSRRDVFVARIDGVEVVRTRFEAPTGALLVQPLAFEGQDLGVLCVQRPATESRAPWGQDALHFVAAYASLISLSVYEILRSERRDREKTETPVSEGMGRIVTDNSEMIKLLNLAERVAHSDATVLLQGETGTGKGLIAYAIHLLSDRRDKKFVHVNCAALPEQLLESELFGHVRGAFTGAFADKDGLLHKADGGTVFLDEIGKTSLAMQGKLLQFLDSSNVRRVGSNDILPVDVRVICASKTDLLSLCDDGRFLEDFFYRINDFPLTVPPLRDRVEDIQLLLDHYLKKHTVDMDKDIAGVTESFRDRLLRYRWPGNVRELEKVIKRAVILADDGDRLDVEHLAPHVAEPVEPESKVGSQEAGVVKNLKARIEKIEQAAILEALQHFEWNKSQAAIHLGISYPNLLSKIKRYNIQ